MHSFMGPLDPACDPGEEEGRDDGQGHSMADCPGGCYASLAVHVELRFQAEKTTGAVRGGAGRRRMESLGKAARSR